MGRQPRPFRKRAFVALRHIHHLDDRYHMFGQGERGGHRFAGAHEQGIGCVDVESLLPHQIGGNAATRKPADIGQLVL